MKLQTKYILFVGLLHGVSLLLSYFIFRQNKILFIASEVLIFFSLVISWQLYKELIGPLQLLMRGAEAIKDRDFNVKFVSTGKYEMDELIHVYNQMIDELRIERTRQEQQHFFLEKLIHTSPTGILILDYDDIIRQANPKFLELLNVEANAIIDKSLDELSHPVFSQIRVLQSGHAKTITLNGGITFKLQKSHFIDRGFPRHFLMIEELTAEILEAEKKTYGKIIRMMAHEVNNTIGPVNSILQLAVDSAIVPDDLNVPLQVAIERNNNLNGFMRNLADLVRIPLPVKKTVDLHQLTENISRLMRLRAGEKKIQIQCEGAGRPIHIHADALQIEQVIINIIKNAIEAIEKEGIITVVFSERPKQLIVRDSGKGISPEQEEHLFTPFFSTKKDGQGIGLMIIRDILQNHGFGYSLKTTAAGFTEFRIDFD